MCRANHRRLQAHIAQHTQRRRRDAHFGLEAHPLPKAEHILDDNTEDSNDPLQEPVLHRASEADPSPD
ncbi:MAG: hypothetical protein IT406_03935 [Candidatus Yanofskybacteria bacterium]|nr:hypothetical protein [Candidatus Yanofskybacteria bacterium]